LHSAACFECEAWDMVPHRGISPAACADNESRKAQYIVLFVTCMAIPSVNNLIITAWGTMSTVIFSNI